MSLKNKLKRKTITFIVDSETITLQEPLVSYIPTPDNVNDVENTTRLLQHMVVEADENGKLQPILTEQEAGTLGMRMSARIGDYGIVMDKFLELIKPSNPDGDEAKSLEVDFTSRGPSD